MLSNIQNYFTLEMIYLWINYGVLPFWIMLIFFPNLKINQNLVTSIFLPIIFSCLYSYIVYQLIFNGENILNSFELYLGLNLLYELFANEIFLLIFWIHFLSISLFMGIWVAKDSTKYNVPKILSGLCLFFIYFTGPVGLVIYWFIRIFFAKKIALYD